MANIIVQSRDKKGHVSGLLASHLELALRKVAQAAKAMHGSLFLSLLFLSFFVLFSLSSFSSRSSLLYFLICSSASIHMPRIGAGTPGFKWYTAEHLIRKLLVVRQIDVFVYLHHFLFLFLFSSFTSLTSSSRTESAYFDLVEILLLQRRTTQGRAKHNHHHYNHNFSLTLLLLLLLLPLLREDKKTTKE